MFGCAIRHLDVRPLTDAVGAERDGYREMSVTIEPGCSDIGRDRVRDRFRRSRAALGGRLVGPRPVPVAALKPDVRFRERRRPPEAVERRRRPRDGPRLSGS